jgi:mannan endo-1,4-beta-mannosidase
MRVARRAMAAAIAVAAAATGIAACSGSAASSAIPATTWKVPQARASTASAPSSASALATPTPQHRTSPPLTGLFIDGGGPARQAFAEETGIQPSIDLNFSRWDSGFLASWADGVEDSGGIPLVQVAMGQHASDVAGIADGDDDSYLISYADAVRSFGHPLILSFGHEMNGTWYSWGWQHVRPATFVAAWRHIVDVFRAQGASNVTWLWTVQAYGDSPSQTTNPRPWWPGSDYVTWVGVDGHYLYTGETFDTIFNKILGNVESITTKPILISETAISQEFDQQAMLSNLFQGVAADGLLGFVYFDSTGNADYRLESPGALSAFGAAARKYGYAS